MKRLYRVSLDRKKHFHWLTTNKKKILQCFHAFKKKNFQFVKKILEITLNNKRIMYFFYWNVTYMLKQKKQKSNFELLPVTTGS